MSDNAWAAWIGRSRERDELITGPQAARMACTLDRAAPAPGEALPPLWHWAFFQEWEPTRDLAEDGHAARGEFLPPVNLPDRMWAGSRLRFHRPLRVGEAVVCQSTIAAVESKQGRSGPLVFVTVRHDYRVDGDLALEEEQDLVYRGRSKGAQRPAMAAPHSEWSQTVEPSPVLLFRYSAVTFNGHRIHYDHPYVHDVEGYPGLIVHGPLIATLMCGGFAQANPERRLRRFAFRGLRPLFAPRPFQIAGRMTGDGRAEVWAADGDGLASRGEIEFE